MPLIIGTITQHGAVLPVLISPGKKQRRAQKSEGVPAPASVGARLLIDTGSFITGLMPDVFQQLHLTPYGRTPIRTPSTTPGAPHWCDQYLIILTFLCGMGKYPFPPVSVIASEDFHPDEEVQGILGRDILDRGILNYHGPERTFTLAF